MQIKTLTAFIVFILSSRINSIMWKKQLCPQMTFDKLLITLSKLKTAKDVISSGISSAAAKRVPGKTIF